LMAGFHRKTLGGGGRQCVREEHLGGHRLLRLRYLMILIKAFSKSDMVSSAAQRPIGIGSSPPQD